MSEPVNEDVETKRFKGEKYLLGTIQKQEFVSKEKLKEKDIE